MLRYTYGKNIPENEFIALIRDNELKNPAPFSNRKLLVEDDSRSFEEYPELRYVERDTKEVIDNVPIIDIVAIATPTNMEPFEYGMTFREVLFECLHGHSLTQETLDYFLSDCLKSDRHENDAAYQHYPQNDDVDPKAKGRRGVGITQRGRKYLVDQGQQRTLLAMFWIFQNEGISGTFKQVRVCR
jgi:hypothetical protein